MAFLEDTYGDGPLPLGCRISLLRSGTIERVREMRKRFNSYTAYSIACAIVWSVILTLVAVAYPDRLHTFALVGGGWVIGWISATIARWVYPPPKSKQAAT